MSFFNEEQITKLKQPLNIDYIQTREGANKVELSYIAGHHAISEANRVFGFGMWNSEIMALKMAHTTKYTKAPYRAGDNPKEMISVAYTCHLRISVKNEKGIENYYEDIGFGDGVAGDTAHGLSSCVELATKEAVTDAIKRCLRCYGDQFGLGLYSKDESRAQTGVEIQNSKPVTKAELSDLRDLYEARGIDDDWVLIALLAEGYKGTLDGMRYDWYQLAYSTARNYKLEEIEKAGYEEKIKSLIEIMKKSANINMLKQSFKDSWELSKSQDDKEKMLECQKHYEKMKEGFNNE